MRADAIIVLAAVALCAFAIGFIAVAGNASRRASQPNPANGPVRVLSEVAR